MAIHEKWRSNGKAHQVYGRVQKLVQQVVQDRRWRVSKSKFESVWADTGAAKAVGREGRIVMAPLWAARHFARDKAGPQIEIYTDGSGGREGETGAGWGFVAVQEGKEVDSGYGPVMIDEQGHGAERGTNNTGEVTAVI